MHHQQSQVNTCGRLAENCHYRGIAEIGTRHFHVVGQLVRRHAAKHELPGVSVFALVALQRKIQPSHPNVEDDRQRASQKRPRQPSRSVACRVTAIAADGEGALAPILGFLNTAIGLGCSHRTGPMLPIWSKCRQAPSVRSGYCRLTSVSGRNLEIANRESSVIVRPAQGCQQCDRGSRSAPGPAGGADSFGYGGSRGTGTWTSHRPRPLFRAAGA